MASRYYGLDRGQHKVDIDEDSSTTSSDVEIVINLAKSLTRSDVLQMLDILKDKLMEEPWAPA